MTTSVRPHISRPVTRTFFDDSSSPSSLARSPGWLQMLRSSVVHCLVFAALTAALTATLDMKAGGGRSREVVAFTRFSLRVIGSSLRSAEAEAEPEAEADAVTDGTAGPASSAVWGAAGSVATTPRATADAVARTASGPMTARAL